MKVDFDDRVLAHLRIVIGAKLRRGESFYLSWKDADAPTSVNSTIWLNQAIPIAFTFSDGHPPTINQRWVESLMVSAASASGLRVIPEPIEVVEG